MSSAEHSGKFVASLVQSSSRCCAENLNRAARIGRSGGAPELGQIDGVAVQVSRNYGVEIPSPDLRPS